MSQPLTSIESQAQIPLPNDADVGSGDINETAQLYADEDYNRTNWLSRTKRVGAAGLIGFEVSPANEVLRLAVGSAAYLATHDPVLTGAAYGGATLAIESAAGLASAHVLDSDSGKQAVAKVNQVLDERIGLKTESELGRLPRAAITLLGGTAISMAAVQRSNPERTKETNKKFALKSAASLAGVCSVQGYFMAKGVEVPEPQEIGLAIGSVGGVLYGAKKVIDRVKRTHEQPVEFAGIHHRIKKHNVSIGFIESKASIEQARRLEQDIWDENEYGSLEVYDKYIPQSLFFAAYKDQKCIGVTRMIKSTPEAPPFTELPVDEENTDMLNKIVDEGRIEELGITAVDHINSKVKRGVISKEMWRLAYRDARERGVEYWGIIMEPERVDKMNREYGFTFRQVGPTEYYQGGDCAAFIMDLEEVDQSMRKTNRLTHYWFTKMKLRTTKAS